MQTAWVARTLHSDCGGGPYARTEESALANARPKGEPFEDQSPSHEVETERESFEDQSAGPGGEAEGELFGDESSGN